MRFMKHLVGCSLALLLENVKSCQFACPTTISAIIPFLCFTSKGQDIVFPFGSLAFVFSHYLDLNSIRAGLNLVYLGSCMLVQLCLAGAVRHPHGSSTIMPS